MGPFPACTGGVQKRKGQPENRLAENVVVEYSTPDDGPPVVLRERSQNALSVGKPEEEKRSSLVPHHLPARHGLLMFEHYVT